MFTLPLVYAVAFKRKAQQGKARFDSCEVVAPTTIGSMPTFTRWHRPVVEDVGPEFATVKVNVVGLVTVTVNTNPTNLTAVVSNNVVVISWPTDHTGWHLQVQTNSTSVGVSGNWVTVPGSDLVNSLNFPIDPNNGTVFFRMTYP